MDFYNNCNKLIFTIFDFAKKICKKISRAEKWKYRKKKHENLHFFVENFM